MKPEPRPDDAPLTLPQLMAQALAMELDAAQRYDEFADSMDSHNNREVAKLFRAMAQQEAEHARRIQREMGWATPADAPPVPPVQPDLDAPAGEALHYLMRPWHALTLALAAERHAEQHFAALADAATSDEVRGAARELQAEEAQHARLIEQWLTRVPQPDADWADDPDPPRYTD